MVCHTAHHFFYLLPFASRLSPHPPLSPPLEGEAGWGQLSPKLRQYNSCGYAYI